MQRPGPAKSRQGKRLKRTSDRYCLSTPSLRGLFTISEEEERWRGAALRRMSETDIGNSKPREFQPPRCRSFDRPDAGVSISPTKGVSTAGYESFDRPDRWSDCPDRGRIKRKEIGLFCLPSQREMWGIRCGGCLR
ncbi:uncharacterized protein LOC144606680 [Rhinoraja longicauda]